METFINDYVVFVYYPLNLIMFFRMSNLIYPFTSKLYLIDNSALLTHEIFLISNGGKIQGFDTPNRPNFARKTSDLVKLLKYMQMFIFPDCLQFSDPNHSFYI